MADNRFGAIDAEEETPEAPRFGAIDAEEPSVPAPAPAAPAPVPTAAPPAPKPSLGEMGVSLGKMSQDLLARKGLALASGISDVVPFAPQIIARLRTLKGPETYEEELAKVREEKAMIEEGEPITTGASRALGTLAAIPAIGAGAGPVGAALRFGAYGGAQAATPEDATAGDIAKGAAFGALVPAMFKGASTAARALAPTTTTGTLGTLGLRTLQTGVRATPYAFLAEQPAATLMSEESTPAEKTEAAINLLALPAGALQELRQGTRRAAVRQAESILSRAKPEAEAIVRGEQELKATEAIRKQRALEAETEATRAKTAEDAIAEARRQEAKTEAARAKAAEEAVKAQRATEEANYEEGIGLETGRELQAARAAAEARKIEAQQRTDEAARAERRQVLDAREQTVEKIQDRRRLSRMAVEDQALSDAQQRQDLAQENRLWEQKNRRAQRAVKDEQRVISAAERLRAGDQAAVSEMQIELAELKAAEDALTRGDDPSLRGAIAKKYQDMRHRLETALKMFQDDGVEPPEAYRQAYDSVRESYLRNTAEQGYVGFGSNNELFLEDPKAWAEGERNRRLNKVQADRTGKEAAIVRFLEGIAQRDYMAEARTTRAGPQVSPERLQEIFADQGLEYTGGPLTGPDGVPVKQAFLGGRVPDAPITSPKLLEQSIARRRQLQGEMDAASKEMREYRRSEARVATGGERRKLERLAEIQAQQTAGFSGLTPKQEIEQAVRARMPRPAGMTEVDILAAAGVSPTAAVPMTEADILAAAGVSPTAATPMPEPAIRRAAGVTPAEEARIFQERREAAERGLEYGTPSPKPETLKRMDLDSATRAVYEMMKPEWLRGGVLARVPGLRVGGLAPGAEAPQYLGERIAEDPTQTRFGLPFQAFAMADRFTRVLQRNANVRSRYNEFVRAAAKRGRGEDLQGFFGDVARFIVGDPEAASEMKEMEAAAAAP